MDNRAKNWFGWVAVDRARFVPLGLVVCEDLALLVVTNHARVDES